MDFLRRLQVQGSRERSVAAGVAAGVGAGLVLWYAWNRSTVPAIFSRPADRCCTSAGEAFTHFKQQHLERVVHVKQAAGGEQKDDVFSKATLEQIQKLALEIAEPQVKSILKQNRDSRRKVLDTDKPKYEQLVIDGIHQLQKAYLDAVKSLMGDIKQDVAKYERSVTLHGATEAHLALNGLDLYKAIRRHLPSSNQTTDFNKELAVKAHQQLNIDFDKLLYKPANAEYQQAVRESLLHDLVHQELNLEEEDIQKLADLYHDIEIQSLQHALALKFNQEDSRKAA